MNIEHSTTGDGPGHPRILLVEDDPTSAAFLSTVLRSIPAMVDCADTLQSASALAGAGRYELWLIDAQLPDGSGSALLARLRASEPGIQALAHTASTDPALHASLIEAGFAQVLVKPLPASGLRVAVQRVLGLPMVDAGEDSGSPPAELPLWDEHSAGRAMNFNRTHMDALRELFLGELPLARHTVLVAAQAGDAGAVSAALHKLRASCGFVGAARLQAAVIDLHRTPLDAARAEIFDRVALATAATPQALPSAGSDPASVPARVERSDSGE